MTEVIINPGITNYGSFDEPSKTAEDNLSESQQEDSLAELGNMLKDNSLIDEIKSANSVTEIIQSIDENSTEMTEKLQQFSDTDMSDKDIIARTVPSIEVVLGPDMSDKTSIGEIMPALDMLNEDTTESAENRQDDLGEWSWMDNTKKQQLANMESQMLDEYTQSIIKNGLRPMFEFSFFQEDIKQAAAELEQIRVTILFEKIIHQKLPNFKSNFFATHFLKEAHET